MQVMRKRSAAIVLVLGAMAMTACGSSGSKSSPPKGGTTAPSSTVSLTPASFTFDFSAMAQLKSLVAKGKGLIGVLLPDTTTSTRYETFDRPYLTKAFQAAGLTNAEFKVDNAQGSAATMQTQAEADITNGASVLLIDAIDSGAAPPSRRPPRPRALPSSTTTGSSWAAPPTAPTSASTTSRSASSSARVRSIASPRGR